MNPDFSIEQDKPYHRFPYSLEIYPSTTHHVNMTSSGNYVLNSILYKPFN